MQQQKTLGGYRFASLVKHVRTEKTIGGSVALFVTVPTARGRCTANFRVIGISDNGIVLENGLKKVEVLKR